MKNLKNDLPTIVSFTLPGWEVGHAIVTIGYDTTTCEILFFNPSTGNIESESEILNRYRKGRVFGTFDDLWAASNLVISSNSMVTVQKILLETDKPIISSSEGGGGGLIGPLSNVLR